MFQYKKKEIDIDRLMELDDKRKTIQLRIDQNKFQQKTYAAEKNFDAAKKCKEEIQEKEKEYNKIVYELNTLLAQCPNTIHPDVPIGKDEDENVIIRER